MLQKCAVFQWRFVPLSVAFTPQQCFESTLNSQGEQKMATLRAAKMSRYILASMMIREIASL